MGSPKSQQSSMYLQTSFILWVEQVERFQLERTGDFQCLDGGFLWFFFKQGSSELSQNGNFFLFCSW